MSGIRPLRTAPLRQGLTRNVCCSPQHTCDVCKQGAEAADEKGQLIPCARCPVAYHLHCLPPEILNSPIHRVWLNEQGKPDLIPPIPRLDSPSLLCFVCCSHLRIVCHVVSLLPLTSSQAEICQNVGSQKGACDAISLVCFVWLIPFLRTASGDK